MGAAEKQVTLTVEGFDVTVPEGTTVLEAAKQAGVLIPHYCYHPGLPIAGVCRMCLVKIEGVPGLQIACAMNAAEGQVVSVLDDEAAEARQSVLEFLLINHPLDCPICDQAGECELQDYVFQEGRSNTRYAEYAKRFSPVEDFGGDILYVPNRCILCTRCVRFMDHVAEDSVINVSERGDRAFIGKHPDRELDHPWSGNVVDLCPVGSLISKDFLHKARVWELDGTPSICTGCSQGCNITIETRNNVVVRLRPRTNLAVNRYFMCDHGRMEYRWMNRGDRIEAPLVLEDGELVACDWDHAFARAAQILKGSSGKAVALVSPAASSEALYLLRTLFEGFDFSGAFRVERVEEEHALSGVENLALRRERAPNVAGATMLGYEEQFDNAVAAVKDASVTFVLAEPLTGVDVSALTGNGNFIYVGAHLPDVARSATVILPTTTVAEEDGSYVNRDGRVQRYFQARSGPGMARPAWWITGELLAELDRGEPLISAAQAFERLAESEPQFAELSYDTLGTSGAALKQDTVVGAGR